VSPGCRTKSVGGIGIVSPAGIKRAFALLRGD